MKTSTELKTLTNEQIKDLSYDDVNLHLIENLLKLGGANQNLQSLPFAVQKFCGEYISWTLAEAFELSEDYQEEYLSTKDNWVFENGFLNFKSDRKFKTYDCVGREYSLTALEFSIVSHLFAMSKMSIFYYHKAEQKKSEEYLQLNSNAVFLSDYVKGFMNLNHDSINTGAIYYVID